MAIDNFIPEVWASELLVNLNKAHVYGAPGVVNRDYEGEITAGGDTVRINSIGRVTVGDYTKNTDIAAAETLTDAQATLLIDKQKFFNFQIDDIDKAQQNPKVMAAAMREAGYGLRNAVDTAIAALYADAASANLIGSTGTPKTDLATAGKPYEYLVDLGVLLDNADVPGDGRFAIVPPWFEGYMLKDARFVGNGTAENTANLSNGRIGRAAGFDLYKSTNVPYAAGPIKYRVIAGHPMAWSLASQVTSMEAYRPQARFADAVKGLLVFGAKVVRPDCLAVLTANPT
jgi:hypothetical protein